MKTSSRGIVVAAAVVAVALAALPALAQPVYCPDGGTVQNCAAWADINGNRQYDPGTDDLLPLTLAGNNLLITLPDGWSCAEDPVVALSSMDTLLDYGAWGRWGLGISEYDGSNHPTAFVLAFATNPVGSARLIDQDGDGCYDQLDARYFGSEDVYFQAGLDFLDTNGDGEPEFVSADWTYSSLYGMGGDCGPGTDAQIWMPMQNSRVVPGWTNTYSSACLRRIAPVVPTLTEWGVLLLGIGLVAFGWWLLRARRALA